jgi:RND family efflux transporter MFP subunit
LAAALTQRHPATDKPDDQTARLEFAAADLALVERRALDQSIPVTGTLKPINHTQLKSKISAVVRSVSVREGDAVKQGQGLAQFDTSDIASQLHDRQANLEIAKAQLALDERTHAKNQALLKQGFISDNAFDSSRSSVEISRGKVKAAAAQVDIAADALNDTTLRAPIAGVIGKRSIQPGERVEVNSDLLSIVDLSEMEIQVAVPTTDIPQVAVGQTAQFKVDGFADQTFTGHVTRLSPEASDGSRSITVFLSVKNPKGTLRGGMFAKGVLALGKTLPRLTIPANAVLDGSGQPYAYWIDHGKVARANLTLGATDEHSGLVEIKSGLAEGATVVATKLDGVKPGTIAVMRNPPKAAKGS